MPNTQPKPGWLGFLESQHLGVPKKGSADYDALMTKWVMYKKDHGLIKHEIKVHHQSPIIQPHIQPYVPIEQQQRPKRQAPKHVDQPPPPKRRASRPVVQQPQPPPPQPQQQQFMQ
jgi:hypothetical protein